MGRCYGRDDRCTCDCYGCEANALPHCSRPRRTVIESLRERLVELAHRVFG